MKYFKYLATILALLSSNNAGALSLNDAISESLANNLLLKIEANSVDIAEEDYFNLNQITSHRLVLMPIYLKTNTQVLKRNLELVLMNMN